MVQLCRPGRMSLNLVATRHALRRQGHGLKVKVMKLNYQRSTRQDTTQKGQKK